MVQMDPSTHQEQTQREGSGLLNSDRLDDLVDYLLQYPKFMSTMDNDKVSYPDSKQKAQQAEKIKATTKKVQKIMGAPNSLLSAVDGEASSAQAVGAMCGLLSSMQGCTEEIIQQAMF